MGKPSPLAIVSENAEPKVHTGGDANKDPFSQETAASEREGNLVELNTPTVGPDEAKKNELLGKVMDADVQGAVLKDATNGKAKSAITGLGVDGVDDMKSVDI